MAFADLECVQIEAAENSLQDRKIDYLRAAGWENTSQTVGCRWMWFKLIAGRHYGCGTEDAFQIQNAVDREEYAREHPCEFND